MEIERKFLIKSQEFKSRAYKTLRITQGYLNSSPERNVRIRITDDSAFLTIKGSTSEDGTSRYEWEKEISLADAKALLELCEPGIIDKTRHLVKYRSHLYEVDEFHGENSGLIVAEIELREAGEKYAKPAWLGKEVTGVRRYYNASLLKHPFSEWDEVDKSL